MGDKKLGIKREQGAILLWVLMIGGLCSSVIVGTLAMYGGFIQSYNLVGFYDQRDWQIEQDLAAQTIVFYQSDLTEKWALAHPLGFVPHTLHFMEGGLLFFELNQRAQMGNQVLDLSTVEGIIWP